MTSFHQYLWFLDFWQPFWPTLGLIRISAGVIKGDLRMFFNPVVHENLVGSLREVYSLLDSWAPLQTHCIRISRVRLGKLYQNWELGCLALTYSLDLGCQVPSCMAGVPNQELDCTAGGECWANKWSFICIYSCSPLLALQLCLLSDQQQHNKCNALESSWNSPVSPWSLEKLFSMNPVPGIQKDWGLLLYGVLFFYFLGFYFWIS